MIFRPIMLFLIAALMLLGVGATVLAAETARVGAQSTSDKTTSISTIGKPRDIKDFDSVPFLKAEGKEVYKKWTYAPYNRAFAINPKDGSWGVSPDESELERRRQGHREILRTSALRFAIEDALNRCSKQPGDTCFVYAQNGDVVWDGSIPQSTSVAQSPVIPEAANEERRQKDALAKADEDRRQKEALAKDTQASAKGGEVSYDQCSINGRLKFKDGKDGCLQNNRYFSNVDSVMANYRNMNFNLALSLNHAQCPAVLGWSYGTNTQYLNHCNNSLLKAVGSDAPQCKCQPVKDIARNMSKEEFYEFERSFASRKKTGWAIADLSNAPSVSQSPAIPATAENLDLRKDTLAKADEDRRQKDALAKAEEDRRQKDALAKANEDRRQKDALAKAGEDRRQKEALAKAEAERQKQEALAKAGDERNQQVALAQAENLRLTAELSKLREQLSNHGGVNPVATIRKALIIGNDSYRSVTPLVNARADARLISENLSMFGYAVTLKMDLTEKQMKEALRVFKGQVNPGDEVAIFYAGHGVQLGSANYLLPVDVGGDNEEQVRDEAIPLQRILDDMTDKKAKFTLAMIDACRDNPFKSSGRSVGGTRGLAVTSAATGQMVIFSAGTGQQALDKLGPADKIKNGVFTRVFVEQMKVAGAPITNVMRNVRNEVARLAKTIGHDQVPAIYDQVLGDFYFSN